MAVQVIKYNDSFVYVDDEVDEKETGIEIPDTDYLEDTIVMNPISDEDLLSETKVDIFGDKNE